MDSPAQHKRKTQKKVRFWEIVRKQPREIRVKTIDGLRQFSQRLVFFTLIAALDDEYWEVRTAAVQALGDFRDPKLAELFFSKLREEEDEMVRQSLIRALGKCRTCRALEYVIQVAQDQEQNWLVREAAAWSLGEFGGDAPADILAWVLLHDPDEIVQLAAAKSLEKLAYFG